ncbi:MAG: sugar-binding domain-containing protein [Mobilitalea sp.]
MKLKDAVHTLFYKDKKTKNQQLTTVWGENLDPNHLLEEYPRPQLQRENYTILNGYWNYCITKDNTIPRQFDQMILVPFSPESLLSGVKRQLMPGEFLWYEKHLIIDKIVENTRCILHFGAVDQYCEVFVNQQKVTEHIGGYLPFSVDITDSILEGKNLLHVKAADLSDTSYHSRGKQKLKRGGMWYTAQSGIWQTVWVEWVPDLFITSLRITPQVDQSSVRIEIALNKPIEEMVDAEKMLLNPSEGLEADQSSKIEYVVEIFSIGKLVSVMKSDNLNMEISLEKVHLWNPKDPFLYDMVVTVGEDRVESYFAMRKIEIKEDMDHVTRIFLNNKPYFQNGLLDQGYWPDGLYTAPSDEAMIFDIRKAKELGFNMLRKHIKIEPLRWYYHCDRLGMMVWQDMVNGGSTYNPIIVSYLPTIMPKLTDYLKDSHYRIFGRSSAVGRREWTVECEETVKLLYNCPCIAVWVPFNEGWGQFDAQKAVQLIRSLDQTRLIDHASGWFDQKAGDFVSIHNYFHPLTVTPAEKPEILSEFGGYACYIEDHSFSSQIYGYRIYGTKEELNERYQEIFNQTIVGLVKQGLSATVYTQLSDVEDEVNGLLTYDRKICKVTKTSLLDLIAKKTI